MRRAIKDVNMRLAARDVELEACRAQVAKLEATLEQASGTIQQLSLQLSKAEQSLLEHCIKNKEAYRVKETASDKHQLVTSDAPAAQPLPVSPTQSQPIVYEFW